MSEVRTTRKTKRLSPITDEEYLMVRESNRELVEDFLMYCESIDRTETTITGYKSDLRIWMVWFKDNLDNKDFIKIEKRDVVKFQNWCIKQGMSPARIRGLRSAASSLSNYIRSILDVKDFQNIINDIPAPTLSPVRDKTILSEDQIEKLLDDLVEQKRYQQACFVAILAASGMRKSEVVQCDVSWFVGDNKKIYEGMFVSPEIRTKGKGKLGKRLSKYIIQDIAEKYIDMWMEEREILGIENEALFVRKRDGEWGRIQGSTVDSWMDLFSRLTGEICYAHAFRHYAGTWLKRNGVSIDVIRDFFGHNDSATTEIYIDIDASENLAGMLDFMKRK